MPTTFHNWPVRGLWVCQNVSRKTWPGVFYLHLLGDVKKNTGLRDSNLGSKEWGKGFSTYLLPGVKKKNYDIVMIFHPLLPGVKKRYYPKPKTLKTAKVPVESRLETVGQGFFDPPSPGSEKN